MVLPGKIATGQEPKTSIAQGSRKGNAQTLKKERWVFLFTVVGFPCSIAHNTQIHEFHLLFVVTNVNNFRPFHVVHIGLAGRIRTTHVVDTRQRRVEFRVAVVVEVLLAFPELGVQHHHALLANLRVLVFAEPAVIHQTVGFLTFYTDVQFVVALRAELHRSCRCGSEGRQLVYDSTGFLYASCRAGRKVNKSFGGPPLVGKASDPYTSCSNSHSNSPPAYT